VHALPYPAGFAGVEAEQTPEQLYVPAFVWPQEFAAEVHAWPEFAAQQELRVLFGALVRNASHSP
jgi:hypothetical protein